MRKKKVHKSSSMPRLTYDEQYGSNDGILKPKKKPKKKKKK